MTRLLIIATALVVLNGCAAQQPLPIPNCAVTPQSGETDGGLGGTGNAPEECPPAY